MIAILVLAALLLDRLAGEPACYHPLVGFGRIALGVERWLHPRTGVAPSSRAPGVLRMRGIVACFLLLATPMLILWSLMRLATGSPWITAGVEVLVLYLAIGARSLREHARVVAEKLAAGAMEEARMTTSGLVSRDTGGMEETGLCRAVVESVLENGNDAIFAPLFWYLVAGAPGVLLYRLANTLDAMWGYKSERYLHFGWAAARLDDLLNWVPARMTALAYALAGDCKSALDCWRNQARGWESPNAGPVMASGAGALQVSLGGPATYHGAIRNRPMLGCGAAPVPSDIDRALALVDRATLLWWSLFVIISLSGGGVP